MQSHVLLLSTIMISVLTVLTQAQSGDKYAFEQCGAWINSGWWEDITVWDQHTVKERLAGGVGMRGRRADQTSEKRVFHILIPVWVCEQLCTDKSGWIMYPIADILSRFWMWKIPVLMLLANIHFAPLGWLNTLCVAAHVLGDPIDFMASLNTRLEVGSRHYRYWKRSAVNSEHFAYKSWEQFVDPGNVSDQTQLRDAHVVRDLNSSGWIDAPPDYLCGLQSKSVQFPRPYSSLI